MKTVLESYSGFEISASLLAQANRNTCGLVQYVCY